MLGRLIGEHITISLVWHLVSLLRSRTAANEEQVVMNLVVNARDAMPGGGLVTIETTDVELDSSYFHRETVLHGHYVCCSASPIREAGSRRDPDSTCLNRSLRRRTPGKALALACRRPTALSSRVMAIFGSTANWGVGRHSRFTCRVRIVTPPWRRSALRSPRLSSARRRLVLLVEDEAGVRMLSRRILDSAGYRVLEAENGDDAERVFAQHAGSIDLLVTDVVMPGCGGRSC